MKEYKLLWVDDEIDLLTPHKIFLEEKGYDVSFLNNGTDAVEEIKRHHFDIIFLDENMPGLSGLETLDLMKRINPTIPIVMITKNEEEDIMDQAIGGKIADYLIKPVKPNQILLSLKKNIEKARLEREKTTVAYRSDFNSLGQLINQANSFEEWVNVYKQLVFWELELSGSFDVAMEQIFKMQKNEANNQFSRFISKNYKDWVNDEYEDTPLLSNKLFKEKLFPLTQQGENVFVILIDNLRYDQWKVLYNEILSEYYNIVDEEIYCAILPSTTQYARNSLFAGLMPYEIQQKLPHYWVNEDKDDHKNEFEKELLEEQLRRNNYDYKVFYEKVLNSRYGKKLLNIIPQILENEIAVIVYNFVDILSHARTENKMIRDLANDEAAYRSLTISWFEHSELKELIRRLSKRGVKVVVTTDHGSIRTQDPIKVVGDKETTTNLRYKTGKNLGYNEKDLFVIDNPHSIKLPKLNVSSKFIFAQKDDFLIYPTNYNYFVNYYRNTFQHGGISMEELLIPFVELAPK